MSDAQQHSHDASAASESHEGPIKTPGQLIAVVVAAFVVPVVVIILMANFVAFGPKSGAGSDSLSAEAVARRIQPVGAVEVKLAGEATALKSGEQVFKSQCAACHASGAAGAPKPGDATAWAPRLKAGYEALLTSALKGKGAMSAQGGGAFGDVEIGRAVVYMANQSGAKFDEPKAPAPAASAAN